MIEIEGRKPYDPSVPRVVEDEHYPALPRPPPINWSSAQKAIHGNDGYIIPERLEIYIGMLIEKGFVKILPENVHEIREGDRMAYVRKDRKFRSGGFLIRISDSNTKYGKDETEDEYKTYLLYRGFNNACFSLQLEDVEEFWVRHKKIKEYKPKQKYVIFERPVYYTNFPVYLANDNNEFVLVKYCRDNYSRNRFITTQKFDRAKNDGWRFDDENGTQDPIDEIQIELLDELLDNEIEE